MVRKLMILTIIFLFIFCFQQIAISGGRGGHGGHGGRGYYGYRGGYGYYGYPGYYGYYGYPRYYGFGFGFPLPPIVVPFPPVVITPQEPPMLESPSGYCQVPGRWIDTPQGRAWLPPQIVPCR